MASIFKDLDESRARTGLTMQQQYEIIDQYATGHHPAARLGARYGLTEDDVLELAMGRDNFRRYFGG